MIQAKDLTFSYGQKEVLSHVDFTAKKGEFLTVLGANGSGKSTLLNLLSGHLTPDFGTISLDGKDLATLSYKERAKRFTLIGQGEKIHFPFTCLEVVLMGRNPLNNGRFTQQDYDTAMNMMALTDTKQFADKLIGNISGGEYQRVILAKALVQETEIFFLDEAFSSMDISYKLHCLSLIKNLVKTRGKTVVSVMHDINMAYCLSDRVCILHDKRICRSGGPKDTLTEQTIYDYFHIRVEYISENGFLIKGEVQS